MILTILGNNGPFPAAGGACSGYLLESDSGNTRLLIDCGSGSLGNLNRCCKPQELSAVVLTHLHFDHMSDMLPMRYQLDMSPIVSLPVYAPEAPAAVADMLRGGKFDVYPAQDVQIGEMKITFLPAVHPVPANSVCVECDGAKFVFTGDTNVNPPLELFAHGADLLLADAGFMKKDWQEARPHFSALHCAELARDAGAKQLVLTHLNPKYAPADLLNEAREVYPDAELAEIGRRFVI